jgi:hypothetical protein
MTQIPLTTPYTIAPATEALTTSSFRVTYVEENYGWEEDDGDGPGRRAPGRPNSVMAVVVLSDTPYVERRMTVWEGAEYLAVRGTWTDATLYERVKDLLTPA